MADLLPDAEQQRIIDASTDFLGREFPFSRLQKKEPSAAISAAQWTALAEQGFFALSLPPESGGIGYSVIEEMLVFREFGRHLMDTSVLSTALGAWVAHAAGRGDLAGRLSSGQGRVALAQMVRGGNSSGAASLRIYGRQDAEFVLAWDPEGPMLWPVESLRQPTGAKGIDELSTLERAAANPADAIVSLKTPEVQRRGTALISAMLTGIAEASCAMAVQHAKTREQFGQPIGAFQAVQHACADMALRNEAALWQTVFAAIALRDDAPDCDFQLMSAKLLATDAALKNAAANIQLHGAMGYTAEYGAHHLLRRAHVLDWTGGDSRVQQARILESGGPG